MIAALLLYGFIRKFKPVIGTVKERALFIMLSLAALAWILIFTINPHYAISSVDISHPSNVLEVNANGFQAYTLFFSVYFSACLVLLHLKRKQSQGKERKQLSLLFIGILFTMLGAAITNLLLPFLGNLNYIWLGPVFSLTYICAFSYAILKHQLFDIRLIIVRALGYALTLTVLATLYGSIIFGLLVFVFDLRISLFQQAVISGGTAIAALSFARLKRFFDRTTNALFYRDAYDPQVFLDELNSTLVTTIDLAPLLDKSASTIRSNIKAEYCEFVIRGEGKNGSRFFGNGTLKLDQNDVNEIRKHSGVMRRKIIVTDDLEEYPELQEVLRSRSIAILAGMVTHSEKVGYLILGSKSSGNPYSGSDIKMLEIVADELALAVQNSLRFEEIQNFANTLQDKVTDATKELRKTNEKLKALDEAKDEFISMASHQLRTPLTSVKGYLSMVLEGDTGPLKRPQTELLEQAFTSSQRMVYLIADLLNVSRLRTGKFVIENKETYLPDVVEGEVNQLRESAAGRKLTLNYEKPKQFPRLMLDETKVRQVVMNFLDNAIYYTPAGGKIDVRLEVTPESVSYTVNDNGVGVPKNERHHLFNKFYRAGNAKKMRPDGTGLGLFMAKKVIVAQGGAIIFKTEEGQGSTFGFSFPRAKCEVKSK